MIHLHYEFDLGPEDAVEVRLDRRANVLLLDDENYRNYVAGKKYHYFGGLPRSLPVHLVPPRPGHWHVAIDLGGYPGRVRAAVDVVPVQTHIEKQTLDDAAAGHGLNSQEVIELIREKLEAGGRVIVEDHGVEYGLVEEDGGTFKLVPTGAGELGGHL